MDQPRQSGAPCDLPALSSHAWLRRQSAIAPMRAEEPGLQPAVALLALRDDLLARTAALSDVATRLMAEHPWDLCLLTFGATHRGGHQLWDRTNLGGEPDAAIAEALAGALREVYVSCDRAIGRVVEAAGPEVPVLVFSLHGMGPNTSRVEILPAAARAGSERALGRRRRLAGAGPRHRGGRCRSPGVTRSPDGCRWRCRTG